MSDAATAPLPSTATQLACIKVAQLTDSLQRYAIIAATVQTVIHAATAFAHVPRG